MMVEKKSTKSKSTPKKRAAKKVEEPKPVIEVQDVIEFESASQLNQSQRLPFDMGGVLAAVVPLIATAMLFLIGWSYESNWYAYFGVGMEQVSIPPQQILVDSLPTLYVIFFIFLAGFLLQFAIGDFPPYQTLPFPINKPEGSMILANLTLFFLTVALSLYDILTSKIPLSQISLPSAFFLVSAFFVLLTMIFLIWKSSKNNPSKPRNHQYQFTATSNSMWSFWRQWKFPLLLFLTFLFSISLAASAGTNDARLGRKGISGSLQQVFLVSPQALSFLDDLEQSCNTNGNCIYGPFGFINENANSFYLINWIKEPIDSDTEGFSRTPGLFVLPRTDPVGSYIIIPASILEDIPNEDSTNTRNLAQVFNKLLAFFQKIYQSLTNRK